MNLKSVLSLVFLFGGVSTSFISSAQDDPARGASLYAVCSTCHGLNGEGIAEMNAPSLAGRESWYLARQIQNFKSGVRGSNADDIFGQQMAPMAQLLSDDQAVRDVAAYLAGLE